MATIVRQEKYIKSDVVNNNNKWWTVTLFDNHDVLTEWGRVGDKGQSKLFAGAGVGFLEKKCREKESARNDEIPYRKLNVINSEGIVANAGKTIANNNVKELAKKQIKTNNPLVAKLIEYFAKVNAHQISTATGGKISYNDTTGLFSTPLGIITQTNIDEANDILTKVGDLVVAKKYNKDMDELTNSFMMLVPQDVGHKRVVPNEFWCDLNKVQYQKQILDNLQASLITAESKPKDKDDKPDKPEEKVFDCQVHFIEDGSVIDRIRKLYRKTRQSMHQSYHLDVKTVYSVEINTMKEAFDRDGAKMSNVWELWHGSRASNALSILKGGLIIPPRTSPHVCGRLYGDGLYFSDQSTKSLNYAYGTWNGGARDNNCFMFLCTVSMGKYYNPSKNSYMSTRYPVSNYDSTFAEAGSGVYNNEMIVYKTSRANINYLIEFSPSGK